MPSPSYHPSSQLILVLACPDLTIDARDFKRMKSLTGLEELLVIGSQSQGEAHYALRCRSTFILVV